MISGRERGSRQRETPAERKIREALERAGLPFEQESRVGHFTVDFRVGEKIIIEVDGWVHCTMAAVEKDERRDKYLEDHGYAVIRVTNEETKSARRLKNLVSEIRVRLEAERSSLRDSEPLAVRQLDRPALRELLDRLKSEEASSKVTTTDGRMTTKRRRSTRALSDKELFEKWIDSISDVPDDR